MKYIIVTKNNLIVYTNTLCYNVTMRRYSGDPEMMKLIKKNLALILVLVLIVAGSFVYPELNPLRQADAQTQISLNKKNVTLVVGKSYTLKTRGTNRKATWKTSKKSVASLSAKKNKSVKIKAKKVGTTTVTARINGKNYKCKVRVVNPKINKTKLNMTVGNKSTLKVSGGTGTIKWKSADTKLATVSNKGVVTAKKAGTVKITATRNGKNLNCTVTIKAKPKSTPTPKPTPGVSTSATAYGIRKYTKNGSSFTPDTKITYYTTKEAMPYVFRTGPRNAMIDNSPSSPYTKRRWVSTSPNNSYYRLVTIKDHIEWDCPCGIAWGNYVSTDYDDFDRHSWECGWSTRDNTIINEQHQEITKGGYWEYYNEANNTWH